MIYESLKTIQERKRLIEFMEKIMGIVRLFYLFIVLQLSDLYIRLSLKKKQHLFEILFKWYIYVNKYVKYLLIPLFKNSCENSSVKISTQQIFWVLCPVV